MKNVIHTNNDPYLNMAIEEYLLTHLSRQENCFMLWQNSPAIIIGRNQNAWEEINSEYVEQHQIALVRRLTGGGAVYHDLGNINFSFVVRDQGSGFDFERFARPIVHALTQLGVNAAASGRNDILIDGRKFSGNSEYRQGEYLLHHGTLLFNSDLSVLAQALQVKPQKIVAKGIKSVRSRVTNISEYLPRPVSQIEFKAAVMQAVTTEFGTELHDYPLAAEDWSVIHRLHVDKYATWQWNYGQAPEFNLQREQRFDFGEIDIRLQVVAGHIKGCTIYGDFFSHASMDSLAEQLLGIAYERQGLTAAIAQIPLEKYFPALNREQFLQLLID